MSQERWLDSEIPDELRRTLQSAKLDDPNPAQLERMRARLGVTLGPAFTSPPPAPRGAASAHAPQFLSLGKSIGLASLIALGFGAAFWAPQKPPPAPAFQPVVTPKPEPKPEPEPEPELPPPTAAAPAEDKPTRREHVRAPGLGEELRQLENIRRWLARSPQRALAATDDHERRFPHGALGPERELLRIDALLRLGQYERARQRAERVLAAPEGHPYRAQVASLLAGYRSQAAKPE
jgi:hypothetical protein